MSIYLRQLLDRLPEAARTPVGVLFDQLAETNERIAQLTGEIEETHKQSETSQRLATIPGVGMLSATIIAATTPDVGNFSSARDYAAWLGLTPKPHSTGGKQRVGRISKMNNCYIRRLLVSGRYGADHGQTEVWAGIGLAIRHADPEKDEGGRHRFGTSHGENDLRRPSGRHTLSVAGGRLIG